MFKYYTYEIEIEKPIDFTVYLQEIKRMIELVSRETHVISVQCTTKLKDILLEENETLEFVLYAEGRAISTEYLKTIFRRTNSSGKIVELNEKKLQRTTSIFENGIVVEHDIIQLTEQDLFPF